MIWSCNGSWLAFCANLNICPGLPKVNFPLPLFIMTAPLPHGCSVCDLQSNALYLRFILLWFCHQALRSDLFHMLTNLALWSQALVNLVSDGIWTHEAQHRNYFLAFDHFRIIGCCNFDTIKDECLCSILYDRLLHDSQRSPSFQVRCTGSGDSSP